MRPSDKKGLLREGKRNGLPAAMHRELLDHMVQQQRGPGKVFAGNLPAHDGRKNMYTGSALAIAGDEITMEVMYETQTFTIRVSLAGSLNLRDVFSKTGSVSPTEAILALDVVFRQSPSINYVTVGRSFFSQQNKSTLGSGAEIWHGHHQSLRYCQVSVSRTEWRPLPPRVSFPTAC